MFLCTNTETYHLIIPDTPYLEQPFLYKTVNFLILSRQPAPNYILLKLGYFHKQIQVSEHNWSFLNMSMHLLSILVNLPVIKTVV